MMFMELRYKTKQEFIDAIKKYFTFCPPIPEPPDSGFRFLIGIATYATQDLQLLESLTKLTNITIDIFLADDVPNQATLNQYIPSLSFAYQTPFIGVWFNGKLIGSEWGQHARDLIQSIDGALEPTKKYPEKEEVTGTLSSTGDLFLDRKLTLKPGKVVLEVRSVP